MLTCSRWTRLPRSSVVRSYVLVFVSMAELCLIPNAARELGIVRRHLPRHRPAQGLQLLGGRAGGLRYFVEIEIEPGSLAHLGERMAGMHALQPEAALVLLP